MNHLDEAVLALAGALRREPAANHESLREFQALSLAVATRFKRYQLESQSKAGQVALGMLSLSTCRRHLSAFLEHVGFIADPPSSSAAASRLAEELATEFGRAQSTVTNLIILDGLEIPGDEIAFNGGRLLRLDSKVLPEWFRGHPIPGSVRAARLEDIVALETATSADNPPFGPMLITFEAPYRTVQRMAHPWLTLLNLYGDGKCSAIGLYRRSDSKLHRHQFEAVGEQEPNWADKGYYDDEAREWIEYEEPYRSLEVDDADRLRAFLNRAASGRLEAESRGHRLGTAFRYFGRVSAGHLSHILKRGMDDHPDDLEDLIVDAVVGLEAIFVPDKTMKGKGDIIARRAAAMIQADPTEGRKLRKLARALYDSRNSILHGDEQLPIADLTKYAVAGEDLLRRSVGAFCLIGGDHQRVLAMDADRTTAAAIRAEAQF